MSNEVLVYLAFIAQRWLIGVCIGSAFFLCGLWLPLLLFRKAGAFKITDLLPLAIGGGVLGVIVAWTFSEWVFKSTFAGTCLLGILAAAGVGLSYKRWQICWTDSRALLLLATVACLLSIWHAGHIESPAGEYVEFRNRHTDLALHAYMASLIQLGGLPLQDFLGITTYAVLTHTGHTVLVAGLSSLGISVFHAAQTMWLVGYVMIVWTFFSLLREDCGRDVAILAALSSLAWASVIHLPIEWLEYADHPIRYASGAMYHNLSQLVSLSLMTVALKCIDEYCRRDSSTALLWRNAGDCSIGLGEAVDGDTLRAVLLIFLAMRLAPPRQWVSVVCLLAAGAAVYLLPSWVVTTREGAGWTTNSDTTDQLLTAGLCLGLLGGSVLLYLRPAMFRPARWGWVELTLIATVGGIIFAATFREIRRNHGNHAWGICGCATLLAPAIVAWCLTIPRPRTWWKIAPRVLVAPLVVLQLAAGIHYAAVYPNTPSTVLPLADIAVMLAARSKTTPQTQFYMDPLLCTPYLLSYLKRPVVWPDPMTIVTYGDKEWFVGYVSRCKASIIHNSRTKAQARFREIGWGKTADLSDTYELWQHPSSVPATPQPIQK